LRTRVSSAPLKPTDINLGREYVHASMNQKVHKLFLTTCDVGERRSVTASDCLKCGKGSVIDNKSRVVCGGSTKFFVTPCYFDMRASATVYDCQECKYGEIGDDRLRVFCSRL